MKNIENIADSSELYFENEHQPYSLHYFAWMHEQGLGVDKSYEKAFSLWSEAAILGVAESQLAVEEYFLAGDGVALNPGKALCWYKISFEGVDEDRFKATNQKMSGLERGMDNESKTIADTYMPEILAQSKNYEDVG